MTTATPPAPYSTLEGALASGFATNQLHHAPGHDRLVSDDDLPRTTFHGCEVDEYTNEYSVNNDVLSTSLPLGVRVLVVTLRKIFTQSGSARLESALVRGLDHRARMLAPDVIENLRKHHFVVDAGRQGKVAYSGNRAKRKDALSIIQSPNSFQHPIIRECAAL